MGYYQSGAAIAYLCIAFLLLQNPGFIDANDEESDLIDLATASDKGIDFEALSEQDNDTDVGEQQHDRSQRAMKGQNTDHNKESYSNTPNQTDNGTTQDHKQADEESEDEDDKKQQRAYVREMMMNLPFNDPFYEYCTAKPDPGICTGDFQRYAFSTEQGECVPFQWGGCGGNLNRFEHQSTCLESCLYATQKRVLEIRTKYAGQVNEGNPIGISKMITTTAQTTMEPITS